MERKRTFGADELSMCRVFVCTLCVHSWFIQVRKELMERDSNLKNDDLREEEKEDDVELVSSQERRREKSISSKRGEKRERKRLMAHHSFPTTRSFHFFRWFCKHKFLNSSLS